LIEHNWSVLTVQLPGKWCNAQCWQILHLLVSAPCVLIQCEFQFGLIAFLDFQFSGLTVLLLLVWPAKCL
jgi:hypothetical protein